jgi:DNA-binding response OmpR family regulator
MLGRGGAPDVRATIVLADDDDDLRAVYAPLLRSAGYAVLEAADGREALDLVRAHRPELVLLDVWMPVLNGFEVLEGLRHDPIAGSIKVVVLSCRDDADSRLECFGIGAADYLVKGLPLAEFLAHVRRTLDAAEAAADLS